MQDLTRSCLRLPSSSSCRSSNIPRVNPHSALSLTPLHSAAWYSGVYASPPPPQAQSQADTGRRTPTSVLVLVPHQHRGSLNHLRTLPISGAAYGRCTGCGDAVLRAYETEVRDAVKGVQPNEVSEGVDGFGRLYDEGDRALESVDGEDN